MAVSRDRRRNSAGRGRGRGGRRERIFSLKTVGNIMKKVLPPKTRISTEVKETVEQCLTEFVTLITSEACHSKESSTITDDGIIRAMAHLGFDDYVKPVQIYQRKYMKKSCEANDQPEPETEASSSAVPVRLRHQISDRDYENGILGVGTAEDFQDLPALILHKIY